jgi:hypothetical protein
MVVAVQAAFGTDYATLLTAVRNYKASASDTNALQTIYDVARARGADDVVSRCMAIYTLHMGIAGNDTVCQGGYQSLRSRYPKSDVTAQIQRLDLFPRPCPTCQGTGVIQKENETECSRCDGTGKCSKCGGAGTIRGLVLRGSTLEPPRFKCTACGGSGTCPICNGTPKRTITSNQRCPDCGGVPKRINPVAAKNGLVGLCNDLEDVLSNTIDCEKSFADAMRLGEIDKRVAALNECLIKYKKALNLPEVKKLCEDLVRQQQTKEKQQEELLRTIRTSASKPAALIEIKNFLSENPDSPVIVEARLLAAEIEQAVNEEIRAAKILYWAKIGCGAIFVLAVLAWLASGIRVSWSKEIIVPSQLPRDTPSRKIPFTPASKKTPVASKHRTLHPRRNDATLPETDSAACPECGAALSCPPDVANETVVCAVCRKAFYID